MAEEAQELRVKALEAMKSLTKDRAATELTSGKLLLHADRLKCNLVCTAVAFALHVGKCTLPVLLWNSDNSAPTAIPYLMLQCPLWAR